MSSFASARVLCAKKGSSLPDDCLFCQLYHDGDHVVTAPGFVAIRDINPKAETHLLVIPERHVDTFRDIAHFHGWELKRMLEFIAEVAQKVGLTDYQVLANVGRSAGQTVFHLHWHVLGDRKSNELSHESLTAVSEL